jgi:hypothetical protein
MKIQVELRGCTPPSKDCFWAGSQTPKFCLRLFYCGGPRQQLRLFDLTTAIGSARLIRWQQRWSNPATKPQILGTARFYLFTARSNDDRYLTPVLNAISHYRPSGSTWHHTTSSSHTRPTASSRASTAAKGRRSHRQAERSDG